MELARWERETPLVEERQQSSAQLDRLAALDLESLEAKDLVAACRAIHADAEAA